MKRRAPGFYLRAAASGALALCSIRELCAAADGHRILPALWHWLLPALGAVLILRPERAWVRNASGVALLLLSFRSMDRFSHDNQDGMLGGLASGLFCMAQLIAAAILFSPTLVQWFSSPLTRLVDGLYLGDTREAPPVTLRLARAYREAGRLEEAIAECERQLEWHPRSLELWREIIASARLIGIGETAAEYFHKASRSLRKEERTALTREFPGLAA